MRTLPVIAAAVILLTAALNSHAQPKSAGIFFSPSMSGLTYQHQLDRNTFWNIDLAVDYGDLVLGQSKTPGFSARFGYNFIIWQGNPGNSRLYAGPGVNVGYARDKGHETGGYGGLSGNLGFEHDFSSGISLSAGISPVFAIHLHNTDRGLQLQTYNNGLLWSLAPYVGIRYDISGPDGNGQEERPTAKIRRPLFTYGIEWEYVSTINSIYHHNFSAVDGYRMNDKGSKMMYAGNASVYAHAGVNIGRHGNVSLYAGYSGLYDNYAVIPVSLRYTWVFGRSDAGWLCFIDGGCGFRPESAMSVIGKAGGGYRISLSRSVKLDMLLSYRCSYAEIPFSDQYGPVSDDRIRRNNNYLSAINLGIGIVL
ncbi:MAG: hypothetical protein IAB91_00355 [Bacteroidetes bacterium]|uniref:Outer membrane protein beta-barrel domain-containing protein n=1 Tax=Candidatus Cryptobacteroides faecigallinarum TaxID=2840763 RepID=A0A9D9IJ37_9BACT|nr:hypothetical protein [Candidatus Cryptobacteroides faecigallinarum]